MFRFAIRWTLIYLGLYFSEMVPALLPVIVGNLTLQVHFFDPYTRLWATLPAWVGVHLFGMRASAMAQMPGPSPFLFVKLLIMATVAAVVTLVWLAVERRRSRTVPIIGGDATSAAATTGRTDAALYDVLRVFVRYSLGCTMIIYAAAKVIKTQFRDPGLAALSTPLGSLAPNELMWYFMGYSYAYNLFAGMGELAGSLLLFFRRTTTLGALLVIAVMSNVVVMDFVYDINSVTIWATHLLFMAVLLVLPDVRRLIDVLIWNRPTASSDIGPVYAGRWSRPARIAAKAVAIFFAAWQLRASWQRLHTTGDLAPKPPLYGAYAVEQFVVNGDSMPPLVTDTTHWRRVIVNRAYEMAPVTALVRLANDSLRQYDMRIDTVAKRVTLLARPSRRAARPTGSAANAPPATIGIFSYASSDSGRLALSGAWRGDSVRVRLRREDQQFALLRPVHWFTVPGASK
ncbi:MAG: hypothetical protein ABJD07_00350 [Gemmatimonadaceae bacterium]